MLQKIDHWIIDNFFQRIVDWGNKHLDVTKSFFLVATFCLFGAGLLFDTYLEVTAGSISIISLALIGAFVFFGPNFIAYVLRKVEREEKGGFTPSSRINNFDTAFRIVYPILTVVEIAEMFAPGEIDLREIVDPLAFVCVWFLFGFLACRNNPPMFKKKVSSPA